MADDASGGAGWSSGVSACMSAAAGHSVDAQAWMELFDAGFARIAGRFARVEPRRQARLYLLGLLADVQTRSCWQLAEHAGDQSPHRMQRLLGERVTPMRTTSPFTYVVLATRLAA